MGVFLPLKLAKEEKELSVEEMFKKTHYTMESAAIAILGYVPRAPVNDLEELFTRLGFFYSEGINQLASPDWYIDFKWETQAHPTFEAALNSAYGLTREEWLNRYPDVKDRTQMIQDADIDSHEIELTHRVSGLEIQSNPGYMFKLIFDGPYRSVPEDTERPTWEYWNLLRQFIVQQPDIRPPNQQDGW